MEAGDLAIESRLTIAATVLTPPLAVTQLVVCQYPACTRVKPEAPATGCDVAAS